METEQNEEELLRSVALQNARFIRLAREQAERERKKTEEALRASEERFRSLVLASAQVVWTTKPDGVVEEDSPSWRAFTGQTYEQWKGWGWLDAIHPDDREATKEIWLRCVADKCICETEYRVRAADGSYRWTAVRAVPVLNPEGSIREWVGANTDITESKQAEEALRESEERFRNMADNAPVMLWVTDPSGYCTHLNRRWHEFTGQTPETGLGFGWLNAVHPDDNERSKAIFLAANEKHEAFQLEYRLRRKDGAYFWAIDAAAPRFSESGEFLGYIGSVTDIDVRKQAEEALRQRTEQFEILLNNAPIGVYVVDADFRIRQVNPIAVPVFDIPDLIGRDFDEVIHILWLKAYADEIVQRFRHTLATGEPYITPERIEERLDRGVTEFYEWQIHRIRLPEGRYGVVCYFRDIFKPVMIREVLRESAERLRFMAESMPQKIFTAKPNGEVDYFNQQWTEFTGLSFEQIRDWGWTQFIHPEDVEDNVRVWQHSIDTGKSFYFEHRFRRKDGAYRWHLSRAQAMRDADGKVQMWIGSNTDIDDQKRIEAELKDLMRREREARATAEIANRVKDEFLAIVSHELRTPLNAIVGWTQVLKSGKLNPAESKRAIQTIDRNARAQGTIINELLDTSRIISGKLKLDMQPIDLAGIIYAAIDVVRPASDAKAIEILAVVEPEAGLVAGDSVRLQQVVWNLLSNAVKFTPKKGRIEVQLKRAGTDVVIVVRDTGVGIPPDFLPHIFERFQQADTSEKRTHGGLGLGLSIARNLVEMHGGSVRAESEGEGRGTTFVMTLPIMAVSGVTNAHSESQLADLESRAAEIGQQNEDRAAEQQRDLDLKSDILTGLRVLAVDDQPDTRDLIVLALTQYGAEVRTCTSATEALKMMHEWRPEIIVSDIGLPDEDGYDLMRRIRSHEPEGGGRIPAVALTGYAGAADESKARAAGYQVHMAKPVELTELAAAIAKLSGRE